MDSGDRELMAAADAHSVEIGRVSKRFGSALALNECSLVVGPGEILALVGPSGCGKTTLLNIVAGFEQAESGSLLLDGVPISETPPQARGVGMVFQNYALFPHLTVIGNIAYGLRVMEISNKEADSRVGEMLQLMKLDGLGTRYPHELSGGQRQRVAVARALVTRPKVLLMDEAFSALDRNLREEMQLELSLLLRHRRITTILVTHDQKEAFTIADRIAVMDGGRILQVGTGEQLYNRPVDRFVLDFLGTSNRFQVLSIVDQGHEVAVEAEGGLKCLLKGPITAPSGRHVSLHIRPEDIRVSPQATSVHSGPPALVEFVSFQGAARRVVMRLGAAQIVADIQDKAFSPAVGAEVYLDFLAAHALLMGD
jgi:ABC-type Fe3+/spermidine/putrescine transport system ATPase subunit